MDAFSTASGSRYQYSVPMHGTSQKGSALAETSNRDLLLNFCRTVVRSDDDSLKLAMAEYEQFLLGEQQTRAAA